MANVGSRPPSKERSNNDRSRSLTPDHPTKVTCHDVIKEGLPPLLHSSDKKLRTQKPSISSRHFYSGKVRPWLHFDEEVDKFIYPERVPNDRTALLYRPRDGLAPIETEAYLCGEEKGVEGRFNHQVMHHVQKAANLQGLKVMLGDFRATYEAFVDKKSKLELPDFACMAKGGDPKQGARFLGECKADWNNDMKNDYDATKIKKNSADPVESDKKLKKWLKQTASYLKRYRLQYGFVTTYNYTMFVRYETSDFKSSDTRHDSLFFSRPIPHHQKYGSRQFGESETHVSVRQVMWFLMLKVNSGEETWKMKHQSRPSSPIDEERSESEEGGGNSNSSDGKGGNSTSSGEEGGNSTSSDGDGGNGGAGGGAGAGKGKGRGDPGLAANQTRSGKARAPHPQEPTSGEPPGATNAKGLQPFALRTSAARTPTSRIPTAKPPAVRTPAKEALRQQANALQLDPRKSNSQAPKQKMPSPRQPSSTQRR